MDVLSQKFLKDALIPVDSDIVHSTKSASSTAKS